MKRNHQMLFLGIIFILLNSCHSSPLTGSEFRAKEVDNFISPEILTSDIEPLYSKAQNEHIFVVHKHGQTFIVWDEKRDFTGEWYGIYRASAPITEENLEMAQLLYRIPEGSAYFYSNRYEKESRGEWEYRYLEKLVIGEDVPLNSNETGLFVWTINSEDLDIKFDNQFFYAVSVIMPDEKEYLEFGYQAGPIEEEINDPLPIETPVDIGEGGHVYIQYMNLRNWNPTFHAPNQFNKYYGLDEYDPAVKNSIQYAYDYVVYEPNCESKMTKAPITIILHAFTGGVYPPLSSKNTNTQCSYIIRPIDGPETWYFGFAKNFDYRKSELPIEDDHIENFTEQRILRMIYDLIRNPVGPEVDTNRIYVYGGSMGGSGALAFSLHFPNVFAAAYASTPMTNYREAGAAHGSDWRPQISVLWGPPEENLPVKISSPAGWADHLQIYNGTGVWDWQNHRANLYNLQDDEIVPIGIAHGIEDIVIEWKTQGKPVYKAFDDTRRGWGGMVTNDKHIWLGFQGTPPGIGGNDEKNPFFNFAVVKDEVVPAFRNANNNSAIPPRSPGQYNQTLSWSSTWNTWDMPPLDTPERLEISICSISSNSFKNLCGTGTTQTVDITPRRIQNFVIEPGKEYIWENRTINNNLMYVGHVIADEYGLITVNDFVVFPEGNKLVLKPSNEYLYIFTLPHIEN